MTITVHITREPNSGEGALCLLEVTETGIRDTERRIMPGKDGGRFPFETVWEGKAILLCEGGFDFSDGTDPDDEYWVNNPLTKYPPLSLHNK